jgi:hypothetical protein
MLSWELINQLIQDPNIKSKLNGADFKVLLQSCFWADDNTNIFKWMPKYMAQETGLDIRTVHKSKNRLEIEPKTDSSGNTLSKEGFWELISARTLNEPAKYQIRLGMTNRAHMPKRAQHSEQEGTQTMTNRAYKPNKETNKETNKEINKEKLIEGMTWK